MVSVTQTITSRELRANLAEAIGRVRFGQARIGISNNGKLSAILISVEDLEDLEAAEAHMDAFDNSEIEKANATDNGTLCSFGEVFEQPESTHRASQTKRFA